MMEALSGASLPRFKPLPSVPVMLIEAVKVKDSKKEGEIELNIVGFFKKELRLKIRANFRIFGESKP